MCCKLFIYKQFMNIWYSNYIYNENAEKNIDLLKNTCIMLIDEHTINKSELQVDLLKRGLYINCTQYIYMYTNYSNYLKEFITIFTSKTKNDTFIQDFKSNIMSCDDFFVLYLISFSLNGHVDLSSSVFINGVFNNGEKQ